MTSSFRPIGLPTSYAQSNTGISAVISPYGRYVARLPLGVEDVLDARLPAALAPTLYAQYGNFIALGLWLLALALSQVYRRRR